MKYGHKMYMQPLFCVACSKILNANPYGHICQTNHSARHLRLGKIYFLCKYRHQWNFEEYICGLSICYKTMIFGICGGQDEMGHTFLWEFWFSLDWPHPVNVEFGGGQNGAGTGSFSPPSILISSSVLFHQYSILIFHLASTITTQSQKGINSVVKQTTQPSSPQITWK